MRRAAAWSADFAAVLCVAFAGLSSGSRLAAAAATWVNVNPGAGGAFTSIGAGPTGILIAGSDLSGAYRSLDHGATWDVIGSFRGLAHTHVNSIGFDPADPAILYLGAEDALYRSADGGATFRAVLDSAFISAVAPAPSAPEIVYAGSAISYDARDGHVYRSVDRGLTWQPVRSDLPSGLRILKLVVDPNNPRRLYLVAGVDLFTPGAAQALFRSVNGGVSWTRVGEALGAIVDMDMDPGAPRVLYVTVSGSLRSGAVYRSDDGGGTWTKKGPHGGAILVGPGRPGVVRVVEVSREPSDGRSGVWESRDGGASWTRTGSPRDWETGWQAKAWAMSANRYGIAKTLGRDLSNPDAIFWAGSQFVLGSFDGGRTFGNLFTREVARGWWRGRGIDNVAVLTLAVSDADPRLVLAGSFDLGLWRSLDGGESWQSCNSPALTGEWKGYGGNTASVVADPARAGAVWATMGEAVDRATLVRSDQSGERGSWRETARGLPRGFLNGLSLDRSSPAQMRTLFVTANGDVYRSVDDGRNWSIVIPGGAYRTTAVDPVDGNFVYAGGERGIARSNRRGDPGTWVAVGPRGIRGTGGGPAREFGWHGVHQIVAVPGGAYAAAYGEGRGLYRSTDRGATWQRLRAGDHVRAVAVDPVNPSVLYLTSSPAWRAGGGAEGSEGILRSADGGRTWAPLNDGLAWPFGGPVVLDRAHPHRILIGSPGTGYQRRTLETALAPR